MIDVKVFEKESRKLYAEGKIIEGYNGGNWTADVYVIGEDNSKPNLIIRKSRFEVETEIKMRYQNYDCIFKYELG